MDPGNWTSGRSESPTPKLRAAVAANEEWEMSKERRKHSPTFKANVAVEAVKEWGDDTSTKSG